MYRYYSPCQPGTHRWRLWPAGVPWDSPIWYSGFFRFTPARVCEVCSRWTRS